MQKVKELHISGLIRAELKKKKKKENHVPSNPASKCRVHMMTKRAGSVGLCVYKKINVCF